MSPLGIKWTSIAIRGLVAIAELEKRGFPSMLVHSSVRGSDTPNGDRASAVIKALQNVTDDREYGYDCATRDEPEQNLTHDSRFLIPSRI